MTGIGPDGSPWFYSISPGTGSMFPWMPVLSFEDWEVNLANLFHTCSNYVAVGNLEGARLCLEHINRFATADGTTMQRIAAYFTEAFAVRLIKVWPALDKALHATKTSFVSDEMVVRKLFFERYPFLKIAYIVTNQAILKATEGEDIIHIIDLNASGPDEWLCLLHIFNARPRKPHLKITCVREQSQVLDEMAQLSKEAHHLRMPFQFNGIQSKLEDLNFADLRVRMGDCVIVSVALGLHTLLANHDHEPAISNSPSASRNPTSNPLQRELQRIQNQNHQTLGEFMKEDKVHEHCFSPCSALSPLSLPPSPKMDSFLSSLWALPLKLMVVTEQDSNHNGPVLAERVSEALNFYATLFDRLDSPTTRASSDRKKVEKWLFGEEIKNIISCEGIERKERHEKLDKWILRLELARFERVPLNLHGNYQALSLLQSYGHEYIVKDEKGCLLICWNDIPLFSISAWTCRQY